MEARTPDIVLSVNGSSTLIMKSQRLEVDDDILIRQLDKKPTGDWRFLAAVLAPVFAITLLSFICLNDATNQYSGAKHLSKVTLVNEEISHLVSKLREERGLSCIFVSLDNNRIYSDCRRKILGRCCCLQQFTDRKGCLWFGLVLLVIGIVNYIIGITRAMGVKYFASGHLEEFEHVKFVELQGLSAVLLSLGFHQSQLMGDTFERVIYGGTLHSGITAKINMVIENKLKQKNVQGGLVFFGNITTYMGYLGQVETVMATELLNQLSQKVDNSRLYVILSSTIALIVLVICPPLTYWYAVQMKQLMQRLKKYMTNQTNELQVEQERTDELLCQMIPEQIALQMKLGHINEPELFENVTIFFSEVVGYAVLTKKSSPFQICSLLNELYTTIDEVLDNYDVYKVETIGDSCMVASGLPTRNENQHASEICTMSLNIMIRSRGILLEQCGYEPILIQAGVHSGTCAAGIIGSKMPRYCLFGDTVNTAARVETSGKPGKIQITDATKLLLDDNFVHVPRGPMTVKGKSAIFTHWLVEHGSMFKIDLDEADKQLDKSTYWKI